MLITQNEIKRLKTNPLRLSWKDIVPGKGFTKPVKRIRLKSGYLVSYTIDSIYVDEPHIKLRHVIISADDFEPDPADMDKIAHLILGDCFRIPAEWSIHAKGTHYMQSVGMDDTELKQFREEGFECGVGVVEGR